MILDVEHSCTRLTWITRLISCAFNEDYPYALCVLDVAHYNTQTGLGLYLVLSQDSQESKHLRQPSSKTPAPRYYRSRPWQTSQQNCILSPRQSIFMSGTVRSRTCCLLHVHALKVWIWLAKRCGATSGQFKWHRFRKRCSLLMNN